MAIGALSTTRRLQLLFFVLAIAIYLPGIWWGAPEYAVRDRSDPWGTDEIGPAVLADLHTAFTKVGRYNPKYPLFGYFIQAVPIVPYVLVNGRVWEPGTRNPARVLKMETVLARSTTVLLAAGLVVVAMETATVLWSEGAAWIAGSVMLFFYPMFYYGRTSNVDMPAMFFTGFALLLYAMCLRRPLDRPTALLLGTAAALAIATKDASYGVLLPAGVVIAVFNWRRERRLIMMAGLLAVGLYLVASGLVVNWDRYRYHVTFIIHGSEKHFRFLYGNNQSYAEVLSKVFRLVVHAMSVPLALLVPIGVFISVRHDRRTLLWLLPPLGLIALVILPVRFVLYRHVLGVAYCLTLFAVCALYALVSHRPRLGRVVVAVVCAWSCLRGVDLTWQMLHDSRYQAGEWFRRNARPGDRVGYYGFEANKLPFLSGDIAIGPGPRRLPAADAPEFLIVLPWQDYEGVHEYSLPDDTYAALRGGTAGYRQMLGLKTAALFPTKPGDFVNPEVKVFVRQDRIASLVDRTPQIVTRE